MIVLKKILVPTDFGEAADAALTYAKALARNFGASIDVLHVAEDAAARMFAGEILCRRSSDTAEGHRRDCPQGTRETAHRQRPNPLAMQPVVMTSNAPALTIVNYAKEMNIDLIVTGTHGRGPMAHLLMGSVAERVVRLAGCPVLVVRHPEHEFVHAGCAGDSAKA